MTDAVAYEFGPYRLDLLNRLLLKHGQVVQLTSKAFETLALLVEHHGQVLRRRDMMNRLWPDSFVEEINLTVHISALRKALGETPSHHRYIVTVPKRGYSFVAPVRQSSAQRRVADGPSPVADIQSPAAIKSIAVLPFKSIGDADGYDYLGSGFANALITRLSRIKQIIVRPTTSVLRYSSPATDPVLAGRELIVDAVIDGTMQKKGEGFRLTVQLINVYNGSIMWAESFDEEFSNLFSLEDVLSAKVAQSLSLKLTGEEREAVSKNQTKNSDAYELYIKGRFFWEKRTESGLLKGAACFQQSLLKDPDYALAHAGLADSYTLLGEYLLLSPEESFPKAKRAALRAIELDSLLAETYTTLGDIRMFYDYHRLEAEAMYRKAIEINPNYSTGHHSYAWFLLTQGRFAEAISELQTAQRLDPLSLTINTTLGLPYYYLRDYDSAIRSFRAVTDMDPNYAHAHYYLGSALIQKGCYEEAREEFRLQPSEFRFQRLALLGNACALSGERREAEAVLTQLKEQSSRRYISPYLPAIIHVGLQEYEEALDCLEAAFVGRASWLVFLGIDPLFDKLRKNRRFHDLVEKVGFTNPANVNGLQ
ncbi:MAG TPA: winged helix-turn-helix domain-containing protein [Blastocatellia bacterium]|nr:winged helix-turn-helix domain-containing protein [Blastocatellia bacterium]